MATAGDIRADGVDHPVVATPTELNVPAALRSAGSELGDDAKGLYASLRDRLINLDHHLRDALHADLKVLGKLLGLEE